MATITISYTALVAPTQVVDQICRTFQPVNAAADNAAFAGTYYDTNVEGWGGQAKPIADFVEESIAHPGVVLALKLAVENGQYVLTSDDADLIMYYEELKNALADQGFTITIATE